MNQFNKLPLSIDGQLELWQARGLTIPNAERARRYLSVISYYRLSAYSLPLQKAEEGHAFRRGVSFDDILSLYVFDRELR